MVRATVQRGSGRCREWDSAASRSAAFPRVHRPAALLLPLTSSPAPKPHPSSPQINSDPYGDGWMVKVKLSNPDELKGLMDAKAYEEFCA